MANSNKMLKWLLIYLVGAIIGLIAGANILGRFFEDPVNDSEGLTAVSYGALLGVAISLIILTVVKTVLANRSRRIN